jgi:type I restriction enzyme, S subunit
MAKTKKVPELRFRGFEGEWEKKKLGDITNQFMDPVPTPHDGYWRLGIRSHAKGTFHEYVNPGKELETAQMHKVSAGNLIVNITFAWEHAVAITDEKDTGKLVSHRFPQFGFNKGMVPRFFKYLIIDERFRYHLWLSSPGGAGRNRVLKIDEMLEYSFGVPISAEQTKIESLLSNLDALIALHQRKHDKLVNVKSAMLEKMFPKEGADVPEIRFKGFAGKWGKKRVADIAPLQRGFDLPKNKMQDGSFPVVMSNGINGFHSSFKVKGPGVVTGRSGTIGKLHYIESDFWPHNTALWVTDFKGSFPRYVYYMYLRLDLKRFGTGSGVPTLNRNDVHAQVMYICSQEEQTKIAYFFQHLDSLISLHQRELDKLKQIKKACLEKMFV